MLILPWTGYLPGTRLPSRRRKTSDLTAHYPLTDSAVLRTEGNRGKRQDTLAFALE
jgi:hypothetical protein